MKIKDLFFRLFDFKRGGMVTQPPRIRNHQKCILASPGYIEVSKTQLLKTFENCDGEMAIAIKASELFGARYSQSITMLVMEWRNDNAKA